MLLSCLVLLGAVGVQAGHPVVELSLASPPMPYGSVSGAIANNDASADAAVSSAVHALESSFNAVLAEATTTLGATISRALSGRVSFANVEDPVLAVRTAASTSDEGAGVAAQRALASKREASLAALVSTGKAELRELAKVVISAYDREIRSHRGSFLRYSRELNIRVQNDPNFKSIAALLEDAQTRQDNRESQLRNKILALQLRLVQALNRVAASALAAR
jgi:hypothetical protein